MEIQELNLKGLGCPLPVLRARKALRTLADGMQLRIIATDPAAPKDFEAFCETTGSVLVENSESDGVFTIVIQK